MIRAPLVRALGVRALLASVALATALTLGGCLGEDSYDMPSSAAKELSSQMLARLRARNMPQASPILVRLFKEESELEVWKEDASGRYALLKVYPICRWSGALGPKVAEGDRQAPEGFYPITPGLMNPNSNYYLAINTGFPNVYDRANNRHGAFLMIHGDCSSRGCYAMTDEEIGEIYALARDSFAGGQKEIQLQAYPFRMTPANMARHRNNPNFAFWKMIKQGNDDFLASRMEPKVDVCDRHYVFDAVSPGNPGRPLAFNPSGRCPSYQLDPTIAAAVNAKQQKDELTFAALVRHNAPTAPLDTGTDGGMNRVFASMLDHPTYTYDSKGHLHVPPQQPGRLPPAISPPRGAESNVEAADAAPPAHSALASVFGGWFERKTPATATPAADTPAPPVATRSTPVSLTASTARKPKTPLAVAAQRPGGEARKTEEADAKPKSSAAPGDKAPAENAQGGKTQEATAMPPASHAGAPAASNGGNAGEANTGGAPASVGGLMSGAQPVVPSGSFDSRWEGLQ